VAAFFASRLADVVSSCGCLFRKPFGGRRLLCPVTSEPCLLCVCVHPPRVLRQDFLISSNHHPNLTRHQHTATYNYPAACPPRGRRKISVASPFRSFQAFLLASTFSFPFYSFSTRPSDRPDESHGTNLLSANRISTTRRCNHANVYSLSRDDTVVNLNPTSTTCPGISQRTNPSHRWQVYIGKEDGDNDGCCRELIPVLVWCS